MRVFTVKSNQYHRHSHRYHSSQLSLLSSLFAASCDCIVFLARLARSPHSARTGAVRGEAA